MTALIQSDRLDLISMSPDFLRAAIEKDVREAEEQLRIALPDGWPGQQTTLLSIRLKQIEDNPALQLWLLRAIVVRQTGIMVGHIGFHSAPVAAYLRPYSPEAVEFGFTVYPPYSRLRYAREASITLMRWARETHGVRDFVMTIRPDNIPSEALAASLGFRKIGSHIDVVDGAEDVLEYKASGQ